MISAEYFVLDGAQALALPTRPGQSLEVFQQYSKNARIRWRSLDERDRCWFDGHFDAADGRYIDGSDAPTGERLQQILRAIEQQQPGFQKSAAGCLVQTRLEFPRDWGLGTSSTLIHSLGQWSGADPYQLLADTFGGSGYDLACAGAPGPISYQRGKEPEPVDFSPAFTDRLYFVHLGQKQNSREGIRRYREQQGDKQDLIRQINQLTQQFLQANSMKEFETLIETHESLVGDYIGLEVVKKARFADYWGAVKSLGAWGGDFVLATSDRSAAETKAYFADSGYPVCLAYEKLIR